MNNSQLLQRIPRGLPSSIYGPFRILYKIIGVQYYSTLFLQSPAEHPTTFCYGGDVYHVVSSTDGYYVVEKTEITPEYFLLQRLSEQF